MPIFIQSGAPSLSSIIEVARTLANLSGHARRPFQESALQGAFDNVILGSSDCDDEPAILLGAHYDSVPRTPGADDNASVVAVCLECARVMKHHGIGPVVTVLFNREEDGFLGSTEFVASIDGQSIREAHIFEMVGYRDLRPGSQRAPAGVPAGLVPTIGDFLALVANRSSNEVAEALIELATQYLPDLPVSALKTYAGIERLISDLGRSDHAPFWNAGIPALMWTNTSEFRNPHYHKPTDTPGTLDYEFMADVAHLALAPVLSLPRRSST